MSPVAINGVDKQGVSVNGVQVKQALSAASETVAQGVYDATTLSTVDTDLAVGNIKDSVNIFGKVGTLAAGGTETIEKYANAVIADTATYTPAASGVFFMGEWAFTIEYFSTVNTAWYEPKDCQWLRASNAIGDGTNFRVKNNGGEASEYLLMRHYHSTGTYERARDEDLAGGATWTPGNSGFFSSGGESSSINLEMQQTTGGWTNYNWAHSDKSASLPIGDGTNLRVKNSAGGALVHVTMRGKMTA